MGYAYRGPTSSPVGSISPLDRADDGLDLRDSLQLYRDRNVPLDQVIIGLPGVRPDLRDRGPGASRRPGAGPGLGARPRHALPERRRRRARRWVGSWTRTSSKARRASPGTTRSAAAGSRPTTTPRPRCVPSTSSRTRRTPPASASGPWATTQGSPDTQRWSARSSPGPWWARVTVEAERSAIRRRSGWPQRRMTGSPPRAASDCPTTASTWSAWMDPALLDPARDGPLDWTLAAGPDGPRTVHVQSRDVDGVLSAPVTAVGVRGPGAAGHRGVLPAAGARSRAGSPCSRPTDAGGVATTEIRWQVGRRGLERVAAARLPRGGFDHRDRPRHGCALSCG